MTVLLFGRTGIRGQCLRIYTARSVNFAQRLVRQPWGGLDFHVRDPEGNVVSFVQYRWSAAQAEEGDQ